MNASTPVPLQNKSTAMRPVANVFSALQQEVDRLFHDFSGNGWASLTPGGMAIKMDLADTKEGLELTAELPGLEEKDVKVSLAGHRLTISGEKRTEKEEKEKDFHFVERSYGAFSRSIDLPSDIQPDQIQASMANGVLTVTAPRSLASQPKTIPIKSAV